MRSKPKALGFPEVGFGAFRFFFSAAACQCGEEDASAGRRSGLGHSRDGVAVAEPLRKSTKLLLLPLLQLLSHPPPFLRPSKPSSPSNRSTGSAGGAQTLSPCSEAPRSYDRARGSFIVSRCTDRGRSAIPDFVVICSAAFSLLTTPGVWRNGEAIFRGRKAGDEARAEISEMVGARDSSRKSEIGTGVTLPLSSSLLWFLFGVIYTTEFGTRLQDAEIELGQLQLDGAKKKKKRFVNYDTKERGKKSDSSRSFFVVVGCLTTLKKFEEGE